MVTSFSRVNSTFSPVPRGFLQSRPLQLAPTALSIDLACSTRAESPIGARYRILLSEHDLARSIG